MTLLEASISSESACQAREDLEEFNKDVIAKAKAGSTSTVVRLGCDKTLKGYENALNEFRRALLTHSPDVTIGYGQPVLFVKRPAAEPITKEGVYGCLALGKMDGGEAGELRTGHAFMWRQGEKHEFGDEDAIYVGFRLDEKST